MELEEFYKEDNTFDLVIVGDLNVKVGPRRSPEEIHIETHRLVWNEEGERVSKFILPIKTTHENSLFQKPSTLRWSWESSGGSFNRKYCLTDVSIVTKFYTGSDHRLFRARLRFLHQGEKAAKLKKRIQNDHKVGPLHLSCQPSRRYRHGQH
ncbi:unnamed protein product [Heligmosomoides polygyrus]|uniref:Endo/exonuclease/phosphatase domain-containing protein n=1 Tax=Heligmosomoides polygyrus TaxID=6339 RepID=A0A183G6A6_HELPZ|nr:unnamed protein product [Heligmosomoides polygyrus]